MKKILLLISIISLASCTRNAQKKNSSTLLTSLDEVKKYWVEDGSIASDTVVLICPGGPKWELDIVKHGKTNYRYIPNYKNYRIVYVHQSQTISDRIFSRKNKLTLEESKKEIQKNIDYLHNTIKYFKEREKTVILVAKSFGTFIAQEYLAAKKTPAPDNIFLIAGRLKANQEMTSQHLKGFNGQFGKDGTTYIPEDENADWSEYSELENAQYRNKQIIKAAYGITDYTEKLKDVNLSGITYIFGSIDQNVGKLTNDEIDFLKRKGVTVISDTKDHSGITYSFIDMLRNGDIKF